MIQGWTGDGKGFLNIYHLYTFRVLWIPLVPMVARDTPGFPKLFLRIDIVTIDITTIDFVQAGRP